MESLAAKQSTTGGEIQRIISNYKKDSPSRKTTKYYEERLLQLEKQLTDFETCDTQIRSLEHPPMDHKYFLTDYYKEITTITRQYLQHFQQKISELSLQQPNAEPPQLQSTLQPQKPANEVNDDLKRMIRRQGALIDSLRRRLDNVNSNPDNQSYSAHAQDIDKLWQEISEVHHSIYETCEDPLAVGYNMNKYMECENIMFSIRAQLSIQGLEAPSRTQLHSPLTEEPLKLPSIQIPKFDGDYLTWRPFCDLFTQLVHNQPISKIHKMWYLKSNVIGDAEKLIRHLAATDDNYDTAWAMLEDRYNNIRLISSSILQRLLGQSFNPSSVASIKNFHDTTLECLMSLDNLGIATSSWDPLLMHLFLKKLDRSSHILYEQSLKNPREQPTLKGFLSFLEIQFQSLEAVNNKDKQNQYRTTAISTQYGNQGCIICKNESHPLFSCNEFWKMNAEERYQRVKSHKLCINCLKGGHLTKNCISRKCTKCNKAHNTLLHFENHENPAASVSDNSTTENASVSLSASEATVHNNYVLLSTVRVRLVANNGREQDYRAILDSGSQVNLVTERLVKQLGLQPKHNTISIEGIGTNRKNCRHRVNLTLQSKLNGFSTNLEAFVLPKIVSDQPAMHINVSTWPIPKNIPLADPNFNQPGHIDVLLGAEFFYQILSIGQIKIRDHLPTLQNTVFGWVVSGKVDETQNNAATCCVFSDDDDTTNALLERFWKLNEFDDNVPTYTAMETQCERHFAHNTKREYTGRFIVRLPFTDSPTTLGKSKQVALHRMYSLEKRLAKNPPLRESYVQFMEEYERLGHMTEVSTIGDTDHYFIPHHCVIKPESSTTKLRVVFDASAKTSVGQSLNDVLHTGPKIQNDLFTVLLRFRLPRYVFTTDIQKMYRQILIHPDDRRFQMIIWRQDSSKELKFYQLNTVTYGTRPAPYMAIKCLLKLSSEYRQQYPLGATAIRENFYVDDGLLGKDSLTSAKQTQDELKIILKSAGFELRKWCANHPHLLEGIPAEHKEINLDFDDESRDQIKTLGLTWHPKEDTFCVKIGPTLTESTRISKRNISSQLAQIFDPLGILAPVVILAKIFMQKLWSMKLSWDEALPAELHTNWITFRDQLKELNDFQIPRHVYNHNVPKATQMHVFVDASEKAYGAVIYLRSVTGEGRTLVRLLCAKSRVAPINRQHQTIARLELCAAELGTQLADRVQKDLNFENTSIYYWTDSAVVLAWINSDASHYEVFVANRISRIQTLSSVQQWRHVSSENNPADILSRGCSPKSLPACDMWFFGPWFLHGNETIWPQMIEKCCTTTEIGKRKQPTALITLQDNAEETIYSINHGNSFRKLQRIVAYMLRFGKPVRSKAKGAQTSLILTPIELEHALKIIIRIMQNSEFKSEISDLKKNKVVHTKSSIYNLKPFLDENGIIRVGGRLNASSLPHETKHQMLLPYNDPLTKLLLKMIHEENMHCGPTAITAQARQRFWPLKANIMTRSIVHHCIKCFKAKPQLLQQLMGNLPSSRVTPARPFINAGVDYCGPFWIHFKIRGKKPTKAYLAIFCCFSTKAVHLELVSDLTTEAFMGALKRFIGRRGHCQNLYSDNATNFVGANNQLKELSCAIFSTNAQEKILKISSEKGINFHFIPPRAPHFGGLWEAAVKSAKHLLIRSVSPASLTYEELETVFIEIEAILNSRPICKMSQDPNDLTALTPGHFLIGEPLTTPVDATVSEKTTPLGTHWKAISQIKHEFWRRWSREYLNELQCRHKWLEQKTNIEPGTVVIVKEDNSPVLQWPLGRITNVYKGEDNIVRVVDVKTTAGTFKRHIQRIAPLPTEDNTRINQPEEQPPEVPCKKLRKQSVNLTTALLLTILMIPLAWTSTIINTEFDSNIGMHFEGIGSIKLSKTDWQLIVYYDLTPFWEELRSFSNGTQTLHQLCKELKQEKGCSYILHAMHSIEDELSWENSFLQTKRTKRGAVNIVGNIANSLFGVLDSEYAQQMSNTIDSVMENENHLQSLLKNQTSILDATINVIKQDQTAIKDKFSSIDLQTNEIQSSLHELESFEYQSKVFQILTSLAMELTITASKLQRIKSLILDVLTDTHHGKISPNLLSPDQLYAELIKIRNYLPAYLQIPVDHDNYLQLYKIMTVEGGVTQPHIIFKILIPLCDQEPFDLYKLIPVPTTINNSLVAIKPCNEILAMNAHKDQYIPMSSELLRSCTITSANTYLCSNMQSRYQKGSQICSCEIQLINNNTNLNCNLERLVTNSTWTQLANGNQWMYAFQVPRRITAVCAKRSQQLTLKGSGILTLEPQCVIKDNFITINGHQSYISSSYESYTGLGKLSDVVKPKHLDSLFHETRTYNTQLQRLSEFQKTLAFQESLDLPAKIRNISYHYSIVSYTALALSIGVVICIIWRLKSRQLKIRAPATETFCPIPRERSTPSDFAVTVT